MQSLFFINSLLSLCLLTLVFNLIFLNSNLLNALIAVEGIWISTYFICAFVSFFFCSMSASMLLPLILVFAGLEVVLGLYFLYFI